MNEQEINEKIHVEIMGEKCFHDWSDNAVDLLWRCSKCPNAVLHKTELPNYCQNISDAFLVVEKLESQGFQWAFQRTNPVKSFHDNLPYSRFWQYEKGRILRTGWSEGNSLAESICLAALKTLENEQ